MNRIEMKKGLFVGLTVVDIQYFVEHFPSSNEKIKTEPPVLLVGGPAANAAIACRFLGTQASLVTSLGQNHFESFIRSDFEKHNIQVFDQSHSLPIDPVFATVVTTVQNGDRAIISHMPPQVKLDSNFLNETDIAQYDFVLTDGFYPEIALPILQKAKQLGVPVIFDGGSWKPYLNELLTMVDCAICSANFTLPDSSNSDELIRSLHKLGIKYVAISRGQESIVASDMIDVVEIEVPQVQTCDTLGAGDILHGAFAHYFALNHSFAEALSLAAQIASFSCRFKGTRIWLNYFQNRE